MKIIPKFLKFALAFTAVLTLFAATHQFANHLKKQHELRIAERAGQVCRNEFGRRMECE